MTRISSALVLALLGLAACGEADAGLKALEGVKAAVCGCKPTDLACAKDGLGRLAAWHTKYDAVEGARSQAAKATAHFEEIAACQASQARDAIVERAGCKDLAADARAEARWCRVGGWGDAKAVKPAELPFGKTFDGEAQAVTVGVEPAAAAAATLSIAGTAEAPTANGVSMTASGAGWRWKDGAAEIELRKIDGGWMSVATEGDTRHVAVFDE